MKKQLGEFVVPDASKCTGCKACEVACFAEHNRETNGVGKTVGTVSVPVTPKLYLTKGEGFCLPIQCKHCEDAPCLNSCTKKAVKRVENQIMIDEEACIGCKDCMMACPFGAVVLLPLSKNGKPVYQLDGEEKRIASKCDLCIGMEGGPACVRACPNEALRLVNPEEERLAKNIRAAEALALNTSF